MRVYKLYPAHWAREALCKARLKVTTLADINDPFEFAVLVGNNKEEREKLKRVREATLENFGLISFSKSWESPLLWSHYADSHRGIALGFDVEDSLTQEVEYIRSRPQLSRFLEDNGLLRPGLEMQVANKKAIDWAYEQEIRMFVSLQQKDRETGLYFRSFNRQLKLKEVILGHSYVSGGHSNWQVEMEEAGIDFVTARIAFQTFRIVKQNNNKLWKEL